MCPVIEVCGCIHKTLSPPISSAIFCDKQSMQWENPFYQLSERRGCLWTYASHSPLSFPVTAGRPLCSSTVNEGPHLTTISTKGQPGSCLVFRVPLIGWHLTGKDSSTSSQDQEAQPYCLWWAPCAPSSSALESRALLPSVLKAHSQEFPLRFLSGSLSFGLMIEPHIFRVNQETSEILECSHNAARLLWHFLCVTA